MRKLFWKKEKIRSGLWKRIITVTGSATTGVCDSRKGACKMGDRIKWPFSGTNWSSAMLLLWGFVPVQIIFEKNLPHGVYITYLTYICAPFGRIGEAQRDKRDRQENFWKKSCRKLGDKKVLHLPLQPEIQNWKIWHWSPQRRHIHKKFIDRTVDERLCRFLNKFWLKNYLSRVWGQMLRLGARIKAFSLGNQDN